MVRNDISFSGDLRVEGHVTLSSGGDDLDHTPLLPQPTLGRCHSCHKNDAVLEICANILKT